MTASTLVLASQSSGRAAMMRDAGLTFETVSAHVDEEALTAALQDAGHSARNIADALAEAKAVKISRRLPGATVIGADQTLALDDGTMLSKPADPMMARAQLAQLSGQRHRLYSAAVAARDGAPIWRAIGQAELWVRPLSADFIDAYVDSEWDVIRWTVGCYAIEGSGVKLFDKVVGDPWTIIGLPMLPLLGWLRSSKQLEG